MAVDAKYGTLTIPGIGDDEPVFIVRARDLQSRGIIEEYVYNGEHDRSFVLDEAIREFGDKAPQLQELKDSLQVPKENGYGTKTDRTKLKPSDEWIASFGQKAFPAWDEWQQAHAAELKFAD